MCQLNMQILTELLHVSAITRFKSMVDISTEYNKCSGFVKIVTR